MAGFVKGVQLSNAISLLCPVCLQPDQLPLDETYVVCKYLAKPLLVDGKCFELLYVLWFYLV